MSFRGWKSLKTWSDLKKKGDKKFQLVTSDGLSTNGEPSLKSVFPQILPKLPPWDIEKNLVSYFYKRVHKRVIPVAIKWTTEQIFKHKHSGNAQHSGVKWRHLKSRKITLKKSKSKNMRFFL